MPTVPGQPSQVIPFPAQQKIDPTYLLMAAATMHEQGRLFEPNQENVMLRDMQPGQLGTPAEANNYLRQHGESKEEAAEDTIDVIKSELKSQGRTPEEIQKHLENIPGY